MATVLPEYPQRNLAELSAFVMSSIEAIGVDVPAASRLRQMHDLIVSVTGMIQPSHPNFDVAREAIRDLQMLGFTFDHLDSHHSTPSLQQLVRKLVKDSVLPQLDLVHSPGRDAAAELFAGAVCASAAFLPVDWEEPDVTCVRNAVKFGLAVKRVKSEKNLHKLVRKAVKQIRRSGLPGIIILDASLGFNPHNDRVEVPFTDEEFGRRCKDALHTIWDEHNPKIQKCLPAADVRGIIVYDHHVRYQSDGQWSLAGYLMRVPAINRSDGDQRDFENFARAYAHGMPNQEDIR